MEWEKICSAFVLMIFACFLVMVQLYTFMYAMHCMESDAKISDLTANNTGQNMVSFKQEAEPRNFPRWGPTEKT